MSQELYTEYMGLTQRIQQITPELQGIEQNHIEIEMLIKAMNDFKELKKGDKILAPIANGIFIDATLNQNDFVKINSGANTVVNKTIDETIDMLKKQEEELRKVKERVRSEYSQIAAKMQEIEKKVQSGVTQEHVCDDKCDHE